MPEDNWKNQLFRMLCETGVIEKDYSGRVIINLNQGGVTEVEKVEKIERSEED